MEFLMLAKQIIIRFNKTRIFDGFNWVISGTKILMAKPVQLLLASLPFLFGFAGIMWVNIQGVYSASGGLLAAFILSLIFPLSLQAIVLAYKEFEEGGQIHLSKLYAQVFSFNKLRVILVYVLLVLFCSFASNYLFSLIEVDSAILNYTFQCIFIVLQFIILLAVPLNIYSKSQFKPFHVLFLSLKGLLRNFIPCLTLIVSAFAILILAILIAKYIAVIAGKVAIIFYLLELWIFVTWLGTTAIAMYKSIFHLE